MEIGIEAQGSLIKRCGRTITRIREYDVPEEALGLLGSLNTSLQLMNQTLFDIKSSNNDLMKQSMIQYNQSLFDRREAWLTATNLPPRMVQELKDSNLVVPSMNDKPGTLSLFDQESVASLREFNVSEKESPIV